MNLKYRCKHLYNINRFKADLISLINIICIAKTEIFKKKQGHGINLKGLYTNVHNNMHIPTIEFKTMNIILGNQILKEKL